MCEKRVQSRGLDVAPPKGSTTKTKRCFFTAKSISAIATSVCSLVFSIVTNACAHHKFVAGFSFPLFTSQTPPSLHAF